MQKEFEIDHSGWHVELSCDFSFVSLCRPCFTLRWRQTSSCVSPQHSSHVHPCSPLLLHLSIHPWLLGNTPSASGQCTWTGGISHYVTVPPLPTHTHFVPIESDRATCSYSRKRREMWPLGLAVMSADPLGLDTSNSDLKNCSLHHLDNHWGLIWTI